MDEARKDALLRRTITALLAERDIPGAPDTSPTTEGDTGELWRLFRALVNTRPPGPATPEFLADQDELLRALIAEAGLTRFEDTIASPADPRMRLWRGDITTLACDGIVNAANAQMLGCWAPGHACIDNAIHTFAGIQLRAECADLMAAQCHEEPTGSAKITSAWNLPSTHVLHTVGPIANGHPTDEHRAQLASCYRSCLDLAAAHDLGSLALCCVSTGVFGFPSEEASQIAVDTVRTWFEEAYREMTVVFTVFNERDEALYRKLLGL